VYTYGGRSADLWWEQNREALARVGNLAVIDIPDEIAGAVEAMAERTMKLDVTIQEGQLWLSGAGDTVHFELPRRM